jgi:hypothetical protein
MMERNTKQQWDCVDRSQRSADGDKNGRWNEFNIVGTATTTSFNCTNPSLIGPRSMVSSGLGGSSAGGSFDAGFVDLYGGERDKVIKLKSKAQLLPKDLDLSVSAISIYTSTAHTVHITNKLHDGLLMSMHNIINIHHSFALRPRPRQSCATNYTYIHASIHNQPTTNYTTSSLYIRSNSH